MRRKDDTLRDTLLDCARSIADTDGIEAINIRSIAGKAGVAAALIQRLEQDMNVRKDIWDETFTKEQFARFIMMNRMMMLKANVSDPVFFVTAVKRIIY